MFTRSRNLGGWEDLFTTITGVVEKGIKTVKSGVDVYTQFKGKDPQTGEDISQEEWERRYGEKKKEDDIMTYLPYIAIGGVLLFVLMKRGSSKSISNP